MFLAVQSFDGNAFGDGAVLGCDFVGEVVELGSQVTRLAKGQIIAGLIWGGESARTAGITFTAIIPQALGHFCTHGLVFHRGSTWFGGLQSILCGR